MVDAVTLLQQRLREAIDQHGTVRAAGKALGLDIAYLSRLLNGKMDNPPADLLRKLRLRRVVNYQPVDQ